MVLIPSMIPVMNSRRPMMRLGRYRANATTRAAKVPRVRPAVGFSPMASVKALPVPAKNPPTYAIPRIAQTISVTTGSARSSTVPFFRLSVSSAAPVRLSSLPASAFSIGPKSKSVKHRANTMTIVKIAYRL